MTPEERLQKVEDSLLVQAELVSNFERRVAEQQELFDARISRLEVQADSHAAQVAEFRAVTTRIIELLGQVVRGQLHGDGRRGRNETPIEDRAAKDHGQRTTDDDNQLRQ